MNLQISGDQRQMKVVASLALVGLLALSGCSDWYQTLEVRITPDAYQVNAVKSALATPAVDEAVRVNPKTVLLVVCLPVPPARIMQFEKELRARHKAKLQITFTDQGCPS